MDGEDVPVVAGTTPKRGILTEVHGAMTRTILCLLLGAVFALCAGCAVERPAESASAETSAAASAETAGPFADFTAKSILGESCTQDVFLDHDVSIVNIMATWCGPCVSEMPDLENLFENTGVGVVGVVIDTSTGGQIDADAVDTALHLADELGITYPMLIPDASDFGGLTRSVQVVPTSYLVDSGGRIVAGPVEGAMSADSWLELADSVKENL